MSDGMKTPYYLFSAEDFKKRISLIKKGLPDAELAFSVKANPFLLYCLPDKDVVSHVEVCSPGELEIVKSLKIDAGRIIYSGVMKEEKDVHEAYTYGAGIMTAESIRHFELISNEASKGDRVPRVLLRLSSGNQFGMSDEDILKILAERDKHKVKVVGIHYYSGTAKKKLKNIEKDVESLRELLKKAEKETGFVPSLVEYGPGLSAEYFEAPYDSVDEKLFSDVLPPIAELGRDYHLGIEMGRFMAATAGSYFTQVMDIKENHGVRYVIADGGIHQLKYYGQNMAMKIPPVDVIREGEVILTDEKVEYTVCGSLCTVADVLVRDISLPELKVGDTLKFSRCGAYSVSEGALSFLSRDLPEIWIDDGEKKCLRESMPSWKLNTGRN